MTQSQWMHIKKTKNKVISLKLIFIEGKDDNICILTKYQRENIFKHILQKIPNIRKKDFLIRKVYKVLKNDTQNNQQICFN